MGDIVAIQSAAGLIGCVRLHQLALATHGFLTVLPRVVEVRQVDAQADESAYDAHTRRLGKVDELLLLYGFHQPGNDQQHNGYQVVVGHLHVVGMYLKRREQGCHDESPQVPAPVGQYQTADEGRQIGQCPHLPDVAGGNDNEEIGREGPHHAAQRRQVPTEVEGTQQQIETQQIGKQIPHIVGQPQVPHVLHLRQHVRRLVRRCQLVGGHTREQRVGPTGALAGLLVIFLLLLSGTLSGRGIVTVENPTLYVGRKEIGKSQ